MMDQPLSVQLLETMVPVWMVKLIHMAKKYFAYPPLYPTPSTSGSNDGSTDPDHGPDFDAGKDQDDGPDLDGAIAQDVGPIVMV